MRWPLHSSPNIYQVGLGFTLLSLSAFFIALILAFSFRIETQSSWQRFDAPALLWASTALLAASSAILESARYALRRAHVDIYRVRLVICLCLGLLFLGTQVASGVDLMEQGVGAAGNPHGSAFYLFMGIHGAHFSFGIIWLTYLLARSGKLVGEASENDLRRHRISASVAAVYWHFMGVVWGLLFYFLVRWTVG